MWCPEPKVYAKSYSDKSMTTYAHKICMQYFENSCSFAGCNVTERLHAHHKNHNHWDNRLINLQLVCCKHHRTFHPTWCSGLTVENDKRVRAYGIKISRYRKLHPVKLPVGHMARMTKLANTPELRRRKSIFMQKLWNDPAYVKKRHNSLAKYWELPNQRKKRGKIMKDYFKSHPEKDKKYRKALKRYWRLYWKNKKQKEVVVVSF